MVGIEWGHSSPLPWLRSPRCQQSHQGSPLPIWGTIGQSGTHSWAGGVGAPLALPAGGPARSGLRYLQTLWRGAGKVSAHPSGRLCVGRTPGGSFPSRPGARPDPFRDRLRLALAADKSGANPTAVPCPCLILMPLPWHAAPLHIVFHVQNPPRVPTGAHPTLQTQRPTHNMGLPAAPRMPGYWVPWCRWHCGDKAGHKEWSGTAGTWQRPSARTAALWPCVKPADQCTARFYLLLG